MDEQQSSQSQSAKDRREFLQRAGKAAIVAPAVALLLSAASKSAHAQPVSGIIRQPPP